MKILVIAEVVHQQLTLGTLSTMRAAQYFGKLIDVCIIGFDINPVAKALSQYEGICQVWQADNPIYKEGLAENIAPVIAQLADQYTHILAPASAFGKNVMPRVAALKEVSQVSNIIQIINQDTVVHPIYAGNALETVQMLDHLKMMTVRTSAFEPVLKRSASEPQNISIQMIDLIFENKKIKFISKTVSEQIRPELNSAKIVISGGRGLKSVEQFRLLEKIADKLHAAVAGSKAAVDAGFISNDYQVGQAGKTIAPDLYIALGISGAIQHLAGMKDSKVIVAINQDPDAPIFQVADYGLVGDLGPILLELDSALS